MNQTGWRSFINLCLATKDEKELSTLLDLFLTAEEKNSLATRSLIVTELLKQEKSQREIAKTLNVSISKITRGSNALKELSPKLIAFLKGKISS